MADGELIGCHCLFTLLRPHNSNLISEDEDFLLLLLLLFCYTVGGLGSGGAARASLCHKQSEDPSSIG